MIYYTSDTHLDHKNIISFCHRPFRSVEEMNQTLMANMRYVVEDLGGRLIHCGDVAFNFRKAMQSVRSWDVGSAPLMLIGGNHDPLCKQIADYLDFFSVIVGTEKTWEQNHAIVQDRAFGNTYHILVSHKPQENLRGCDFNIHGHLHNNKAKDGDNPHHIEDCWAWDSPKHINVCVENTHYMPVRLEELIDANGRKRPQ